MGKVFIFGLLIMFLSACSSSTGDGLVVFDTEISYPEREILLSEVCDVTYIPLDNAEVVSGRPRLVTDQLIIYSNRESDLIFFDRQGHFISKFNHRGLGPGEYAYIGKITYDAASDCLVVAYNNKILYYTMSGEFLREHTLDPSVFVADVKDYSSDQLLVNNLHSLASAYLMIDKASGKAIDSIGVAAEQAISPYVQFDLGNNMKYVYMPSYYNMVRSRDGILINNISADTFYLLSEEKVLRPYLARHPSVQDQTYPHFVNAWVETSSGYFLSTVERKFDAESQEGFEQAYYMIEKESLKIYQVHLVNDEIEDYEIHLDPEVIDRSVNASWGFHSLSAEELVEARDEGRIQSPELAGIVREMDEEDNPVLLFMRFK